MRRVIDDLKAKNEFQIVGRKVTGHFELAAVCQASQRKSEAPILFQQVDDSQFKVVTNLYGSRERLCRLIGADDGKFCRKWIELMDSGGKNKNRPVFQIDGWGGQTITIDFEQNKIIAILAIHRDYNWMKLVHSKF